MQLNFTPKQGQYLAFIHDDFVRLVDSMGPKKMLRITKSEAAFMKQLVKKDNAL